MKVVRPAVMALGLMTVGPVLLTPAASHAADATLAEPLVGILPVSELIGDGKTTVKMHVVGISADGTPIVGMKLRVSASQGTVAGWVDLGGGLYSFDFTPPELLTAGEVKITARGRTPTREAVSLSSDVKVVPPHTKPIEGSSDPSELVLGQVDEATVTLTGGMDVRARVRGGDEGGALKNLADMGNGKYSARFEAPRVNFPHLAIITAVSGQGTGPNFGYAVIPLQGSVDYPVQATPNATVMLRVGDREFGPVQATPQGTATVSIVVPPGVKTATVVSVVNGQTTEEPLDLRVPETNALTLFPVPSNVPADSAMKIPIRAVLLGGDGSPNTSAELVFTASEGSFGDATHLANGVYEAEFTPADGDGGTSVNIDVALKDSTVHKDSMSIKLVAGRPHSVTLTSKPPSLSGDVDSFRVTANAVSASGGPVPGRAMSFVVENATLKGSVTDKGDGNYFGTLTPGEAGSASITAGILTGGNANPVRRVVLVPTSEWVANDGASAVGMTVAAIDAYGYPVPNAEIALSVESGGGSLPESVETNENGLGWANYTAGSDAGVVRIWGMSNDFTGATTLLQTPAGVSRIDLPVSGSPELVAVEQMWQASTPTLVVPGDGAAVAGPPIPLAELGPAGAPIAKFNLGYVATDDPNKVAVYAGPLNAEGKGVPGATVDFMTSAGALGAVSEGEGAHYVTELDVPEGFEGEIKVSAIAESGAMGLLKVPVPVPAADTTVAAAPAAVAAAPAWGSTAPAEPEPAAEEPDEKKEEVAAAAPEPKAEKVPREKDTADDANPWMRARISGLGSVYRYEQSPSETPGPLLPTSLSVGGSSGGSSATPVGFELAARGWLEDLTYLGFHGSFRASRYAIEAAAFEGTADDWLYDLQLDVTGRYPFDVSGDEFWVGGKLGFLYNDFMIFTGCLDPGCAVNFDPLAVVGFGLGAEIGAEVSDFFFVGGYTQGFAQFTFPYSSSIDANIGYDFMPNAFAEIGFTSVTRRVELEGEDSGTIRGDLTDGQQIFRLGIGVSL